MGTLNYFKELELTRSATGDDVRTAYKKLAKLWHPDKNQTEGAEEKFKKILEAYNHLQSDDRREIHAAELKRAEERKNAATSNCTSHASSNASTSSGKTTTTDVPKHKTESTGTRPTNRNWWDSFKQKPSTKTKTNKNTGERPKTSRTDERARAGTKSPGFHAFMNSFKIGRAHV